MTANLTTRLGQLTSSPAGGPYTGANKIINGDMVIDQRNAGASTSITSGYKVDRWNADLIGASTQTMTAQQVSDAPSGLLYSLKCTVGGTGAAPGAGMISGFTQPIEGLNITDLNWGTANAKTVTLSFWAKVSVAGTYGVALRNATGARGYVVSFVMTANTWTLVTSTVAGDQSGTWLTTNGIGLALYWDLGSGTTYSIAAGAWTATGNPALGLTGGTKIAATTGGTYQITGVKLEVGSIATPFVPDDYQVSFAKCQRYYQVRNNLNSNILGSFYLNTQFGGGWSLPVVMRSTPTITVASGAYYIVYRNNTSQALSSFLVDTATTTDVAVYQGSGITGTAGMAGLIRINAVGGAFTLSAEL